MAVQGPQRLHEKKMDPKKPGYPPDLFWLLFIEPFDLESHPHKRKTRYILHTVSMISIRTIVTSAIAVMAVPANAGIINLVGPLIYKTVLISGPAQLIDLITGPLIVVNQGPFPEVIQRLTDVINSTNEAAEQINGLEVLTEGGDNPSEVADYYTEFVAHQISMLNLLREKAGLFTLVPLIGQPMTAILRDGQISSDGLGAKIEAAIDPSYGNLNTNVIAARGRLNSWYNQTVDSYNGLIGLRRRGEYKDNGEANFFVAWVISKIGSRVRRDPCIKL
ncbi:hypothetical protein QBC38DRAFT_467634 [Podospora fimiseda]|uniref:Uncharacterized protein n=1 Tax=Podospora fimiseda TaxID=252190 RepID=A0AAN7BXB2_9PEZI|nr:hypothetical protein QBC38DRAFT_467634 [Podospora fimiseda]